MDEKYVKEYFSKELRVRMAADNISGSELSQKCQLSGSKLSEYRYGTRLPNPWQLVLMADSFACTVNDLLGFKDRADIFSIPPTEMFYGENTFAEHVASKIVNAMDEQHIDVEELTNMIKSSPVTVSKWFSRWPSLPRTVHLLRICEALNCTPSELLGY